MSGTTFLLDGGPHFTVAGSFMLTRALSYVTPCTVNMLQSLVLLVSIGFFRTRDGKEFITMC